MFLLLFFDSNYAVGTHGGAESAADAGRLVFNGSGVITLCVDLCFKFYNFFRAGTHAKTAAFAKVLFECDFCHSFMVLSVFYDGWNYLSFQV